MVLGFKGRGNVILVAEFDIDKDVLKDDVVVLLIVYEDALGVTFESLVFDSATVADTFFVCDSGDFSCVVESDMEEKYDSVESDVWTTVLEMGKLTVFCADGFVMTGIRDDNIVCDVVLHIVVLSQATLLLAADRVVVCWAEDSEKESRSILINLKVAVVQI